MNTAQALRALGITDLELRPEEKEAFDRDGFFIAENVFTPEEVATMKAEFDRLRGIEGEMGGHEVHIEPGAPRLSNLFNKSAEFDRCLTCRPTLVAAHYLLGEIHTYSLNARNPLKGEGQQPLHSDVPRVHPTDWRAVNSMVMLDDMTEDNGPTRVVPGSHKWSPLNVPEVNLAEVTEQVIDEATRPRIPQDPLAPYPGEFHVTGKAGSVAVINGCCWHGGTVNTSGKPRRVLHLAIGRRDVPQQTVERKHLGKDLYDRSNAAIRYLLDIEGAEPVVFGYPPLPDKAETWLAIGADGAHHEVAAARRY
ncbi:MAG: phytanoyl-CoA dioxygenase family protein [Alphaproteobacteria bacterium]